MVASKAVELFEEITSRRKDYIAQPKDNGYQSLHCTVKLPPVTVECEGGYSTGLDDAALEECLLKEGPTCELQIRTQSKSLHGRMLVFVSMQGETISSIHKALHDTQAVLCLHAYQRLTTDPIAGAALQSVT